MINKIKIIFRQEKQKIKINEIIRLNTGPITGDEYTGDYTVVPKVISQTLNTKQKILKENIQITEIPYSSTTNLSGGFTITIGDTPTYPSGETIKFFKLEEQ